MKTNKLLENTNNIIISFDIFSYRNVVNHINSLQIENVKCLVITDKLVHLKNVKNVTQFPYNYYHSKELLDQLNKAKVVVFHGLVNEHIQLVNKLNPDIKILWIMLGADGLYNKKFGQRWYSKETTRILNKNKRKKTILQKLNKHISNTFLFEIIYLLRKKKWSYDWCLKKAIKKINYIAPVIKEDYYLIKEKFRIKAKFIQFSIGSLKTLLNGQKFDIKYNQNNILLGNSADPSNNHIDIFHLLKDINLKGKVICPLSYGKQNYKDEIIKEGNRLFGDKFYPLVDFLPIEKYQKIINSCGIVVMNHLRQQAMGSIISALYQGKKVFLNEDNYTNNFFSRLKVKVYSVQKDLKSTIKNNNIIEENKIIIRNRLNLEKYYSHEEVLRKTRKLIEIITKRK